MAERLEETLQALRIHPGKPRLQPRPRVRPRLRKGRDAEEGVRILLDAFDEYVERFRDPLRPSPGSLRRAAAGGDLADEDGQHSDWIEIENRGASPVNLDGWFLTDNPADLSRWRFPSVPLAAGERGQASSWRASGFELGPPGAGESSGQGMQVPGDVNQDAVLNLSDSVALLHHLFLGDWERLPCGDGTAGDPGNVALLDADGNGGLNLTDAVHALNFLFLGGPPPLAGTECTLIPGCLGACP